MKGSSSTRRRSTSSKYSRVPSGAEAWADPHGVRSQKRWTVCLLSIRAAVTRTSLCCGGRMKQLLQNVSTGEITVDEVPAPAGGPASLLVATRFSVISAGTERAVLEIGRASLVGK